MAPRKMSLLLVLAAIASVAAGLSACATEPPPKTEEIYNIIRPPEAVSKAGGIPPDKEADIQLLLQQRAATTRRCYQDVLNEKHDRKFQGSVKVLITVEPSGKPSEVKIVGGTLGDKDVESCLITTIEDFEFPQLATAGDVLYEFRFSPAY